MASKVLTNYTDITFLNCIKENLRTCESFRFTVSFIKKAGLVLLWNDLKSAIERGAKGELITSTYQNFTDIESLKLFLLLATEHSNFTVHLDGDSYRKWSTPSDTIWRRHERQGQDGPRTWP